MICDGNSRIMFHIIYLKLFLVISEGNIICKSQEEIFPLERYRAARRVYVDDVTSHIHDI